MCPLSHCSPRVVELGCPIQRCISLLSYVAELQFQRNIRWPQQRPLSKRIQPYCSSVTACILSSPGADANNFGFYTFLWRERDTLFAGLQTSAYSGMHAGSSGASRQFTSQLSAISEKSTKSTLQSSFKSPSTLNGQPGSASVLT